MCFLYYLVLACCSTSTSLEESVRKNIVLMSSHSGSVLDSFRHTDSSSDPSKNQNKYANKGNTAGPAATCVAFGGKSRYLCIGDQQGDVCLWDLKKQSRVRQFKAKRRQSCLQACLDPTATYVCALSAETFTLYHLRQATFAKQWKFTGHNNKGGWNQFRFSPLQPSLMALGDTVGRIQLHDGLDYEQPLLVCGGGHTSHASTSTSLLPHHASPITGLAFSTQNSKLLANVRQNGILEFVDTSTGEVIHHQQTGGSATALAFQGVSCVVGTQTGEVQVYDLRKMMQQFGKAVTTYQMPKTEPITPLEFAPIPKASTSSTSGRNRTRSTSPPSRRHSGNSSVTSFGLGSTTSFDLESRASMTSYNDPPLLPNASTLTNNDFPPASVIQNKDPEEQQRKAAAIAAKDNHPSVSTSTTPKHFHLSQLAVASETARNPVPASLRFPQTKTPPNVPDDSNVKEKEHQSKNIPNLSIQPVNAVADKQGPGSTVPTSDPPFKPDNPSSSQGTETRPTSNNISVSNPNSTINQSANNRSGLSSESPGILQSMIRQELQQSMFGLREEMESSLRNLHVDMIRQFQKQSQEMTFILRRQQSQMDQLMQENDFLREQNASLLQQIPQQQQPSVAGRDMIESSTSNTGTLKHKNKYHG